MFAWLGKAQEEIGLSCISFRCTSGRNIVYLCFCVCVKNVYSGNTTPNTGINQLVPWCSLWMLIKHDGHLSYFLSIGGSTCKCKKKKKESIDWRTLSTTLAGSLQWLPLVCSGFHWFFFMTDLTHYAIPKTVQVQTCTLWWNIPAFTFYNDNNDWYSLNCRIL